MKYFLVDEKLGKYIEYNESTDAVRVFVKGKEEIEATQISLSEAKEQIVKLDDTTAIRYKVVEERIDLEGLKREKESLEALVVDLRGEKIKILDTYPDAVKDVLLNNNTEKDRGIENAIQRMSIINSVLT